MGLAAGELNRRVRIEALLPLLDSNGDPIQDPETGEVANDWQLIANGEVWAKIAPMSVRNYLAAQQMQSDVSTIITIRFRDDIAQTMRIVHKSTIYNIRGVLTDPKSGIEYLSLPCASGTNAG